MARLSAIAAFLAGATGVRRGKVDPCCRRGATRVGTTTDVGLLDVAAGRAGACEAWRALYAGTRKFSGDLTEHIALENAVLFPRFEG